MRHFYGILISISDAQYAKFGGNFFSVICYSKKHQSWKIKKLLSSKFYQNFFTRHRTKFCLMTGMNFGSNSYLVKLCKAEQAIGNREQKRENKQESEQLGFKSFLLPVARSLFPPRRGDSRGKQC